MAQISIIKKTEIVEAKRFDAEYFKPEYLEIEKKLEKIEHNKIGEIFYPIKNGFDFRDYEKKGKTYYIRTADIKENGFQETAVKIDFEEIPEKVKLKLNDILFTRKGNYGKNCLVDKKIENSLISSEIMILRKRENSFNHYFLSIFLRCKFGKQQIERNIHGVSNFSITQTALESLKIPIFSNSFQLQIEKLVKQAHQNQAKSKKLYKEAELLLLEELGLLDFEVKHQLTFTTQKKEVEKAKRFDAEYFQPKYDKIIKNIENYKGGFCKVEDKFLQNKKLSKKDKNFYNYIEIGDINISSGEVNFNKIVTSKIPANGKISLEKNNLLISKVRPYRGAVGIVNSDKENLLGSGAFTVIKENSNYKKEVLLILLRIECLKDYLLKFNVGTSYPVVKDENILNLKIPLISQPIQEKIAKLIGESHQLRKEAKVLLERAKKKVEQEIEKRLLV